jgi:uncharacterized SAM-dependent methyltransferase
VTARFNLNLLERINRELAGNFQLSRFQHVSIYDERHNRIEMHLISKQTQTARVCGRSFHFAAGESIHTENSYKYTADRFHAVARAAGWKPSRFWTDDRNDFSVHELIVG